MRNDIADNVRVSHDVEVETPTPVHPGLPEILGFIVFLGLKGRMTEIQHKEPNLLEEGLAHAGRRIFQGLLSARKIINPHRERLAVFATALFLRLACIEAIISSAVLNGPYLRPFLRSSFDSARRPSIARRC